MVHHGRCHCGRLSLTFTTARSVEALPLRACQCSFCRRHGARTTSDPEGQVTLRIPGTAPRWYRFGLHATDFWVCPDCGVYLGACTESDGTRWAVVNVLSLDTAAEFTQPPTPVVYDGEAPGDRLARRLAMWTPARIDTGGG